MEFGWQPSVSHSDFAGILNANGLYSFTVGIPQLMFAIAFLASQGTPVEFLCAAKDPRLKSLVLAAPLETMPSSVAAAKEVRVPVSVIVAKDDWLAPQLV